jgi:hypothetical protein
VLQVPRKAQGWLLSTLLSEESAAILINNIRNIKCFLEHFRHSGST